MSKKRRIVKCDTCRRKREHYAFEMCHTCWYREYKDYRKMRIFMEYLRKDGHEEETVLVV